MMKLATSFYTVATRVGSLLADWRIKLSDDFVPFRDYKIPRPLGRFRSPPCFPSVLREGFLVFLRVFFSKRNSTQATQSPELSKVQLVLKVPHI